MRISSFVTNKKSTYGLLQDDQVHEVSDALRARYPSLRSLLEADSLAALLQDTPRAVHAADAVEFLPVIPNPDKVICVGVNYRPHIEEMGREMPKYPVVFVRFPGSLVGHDQPLLKPRVSPEYDFEGELAIIIGKSAHNIRRENAFDVIAGYCCFMDGSVRDWQRHTTQFTAGKNFVSSGASGPCMVTCDDIDDPRQLRLTTRVNGALMQESPISDLVFDIPQLIEYCSTFTELLPGDVIATGTPGGVGAGRDPKAWLQVGDIVEVEVSGIGRLRNQVRAEV